MEGYTMFDRHHDPRIGGARGTRALLAGALAASVALAGGQPLAGQAAPAAAPARAARTITFAVALKLRP
jgi:hypothetical protein